MGRSIARIAQVAICGPSRSLQLPRNAETSSSELRLAKSPFLKIRKMEVSIQFYAYPGLGAFSPRHHLMAEAQTTSSKPYSQALDTAERIENVEFPTLPADSMPRNPSNGESIATPRAIFQVPMRTNGGRAREAIQNSLVRSQAEQRFPWNRSIAPTSKDR
jgi:hypothetical protein